MRVCGGFEPAVAAVIRVSYGMYARALHRVRVECGYGSSPLESCNARRALTQAANNEILLFLCALNAGILSNKTWPVWISL